jgi:enamine deaminase RidA (YjgF/YER057c/UK114 family)
MTMSFPSAEEQLRRLGIDLPKAPKPLGVYVETVQSGNLLFITGQIPVLDGVAQFTGRLGDNLDVNDGQRATRLAALNALAAAREQLGSLDRISRVVKTEVCLVTTDEFIEQQPKTADGASELFRDVFGEERLSVRKVFGIASIPMRVPAMVELVLEIGE